MTTVSSLEGVKTGRVRWIIVAMLFAATTVNYADRATIAIAGPALAKELALTPVQMGYIFSAFGWSYMLFQLPGGLLLDRFGSKMVYFWSIFIWSLFTLAQGFVHFAGTATAMVAALFALRFLVGIAESPSSPANGRIVMSWFPANERGTAAAIFNSAQYFATALFAPIMGWLVASYGWPYVFYFMGIVGILVALVWLKTVYNPTEHPHLGRAELDYIERGGALVRMNRDDKGSGGRQTMDWDMFKQLLTNRTIMGVNIAQYCIVTLTYFFLTWFPVYLVQQRGMSIIKAGAVASIPAICGFVGGVLGGVLSDLIYRKTGSLNWGRKTPIVIGMVMSMSMVLCNYVDAEWLVVVLMAISFFGKGIGALGWAVVSDTVPRETAGVAGGLFNMFGNIAAITTPIAIGYIVAATGSYNGALVFVAANAAIAIVCYLFFVGDIKRVELTKRDRA